MSVGKEVLHIDKINWNLSVVALLELTGLIVCGVKLLDANKKLSAETQSASKVIELERQKKEVYEKYSQLESDNKELLSLASKYKEAQVKSSRLLSSLQEKYSQLELDNKQLSSLVSKYEEAQEEYSRLSSSSLEFEMRSLENRHQYRLGVVRGYMEKADEKYIYIGHDLVELSYAVEKCMEKIGEEKGMNKLVQEQLPWLLTGRKTIFTGPNEDGAERKLAEQRLLDALVVRKLDYGKDLFGCIRKDCPSYVINALKALGKAYKDYNDALNFGSESDVPKPLVELHKFCLEFGKRAEINDVDGNDPLELILCSVGSIVRGCEEVKQLEATIKDSLTPKSEDSST